MNDPATTSIFWLGTDPEGLPTAFIATSNAQFNASIHAETLDDLLGGCYDGEIFYLSATDGYARSNRHDFCLDINNHATDLLHIPVNREWLELATEAKCFVWIVGLEAEDPLFDKIHTMNAEQLSSLMWDQELITLISVCVADDPKQLQ